jgi:hypothetical protein
MPSEVMTNQSNEITRLQEFAISQEQEITAALHSENAELKRQLRSI